MSTNIENDQNSPQYEVFTNIKNFGLESFADKIKELGVESKEDLASLTEADLVGIGVQIVKARKFVRSMQQNFAEKPMVTQEQNISFDTILPTVPDDDSWLSVLRTDGVRKQGLEQSIIISAVRAALANRFHLYEIPKMLLKQMEEYIDMTEEQVGEEFWKLRKQITRKSYGDLFEAIDGLDASFVSEKRKTELLSRIDEYLWPAVLNFQSQLEAWQTSWTQGVANPGMMMAAVMAAAGNGAAMPPGMMQPPDCGILRDSVSAVNDALNRTFRGTGVQITAALAYEANEIKKMISNPKLPVLCGVPTRELLLKKLGVNVPATYQRLEQSITKYMLSIMASEKIGGGSEELQYFGTLYMLGMQIPWSDLTTTRTLPTGIKVNGKAPRAYVGGPASFN